MPAKAVILWATFLALALPVAGNARADTQGLAPAGADAVCKDEPPDPQAILDKAKADGFSINPAAFEALRHVGETPAGRVIVGFKGPKKAATTRSVQSVKRINAGDVAALGCAVGSAAHVNWNSGSGVIQEYWTWHSIGGQTGKASPPSGTCSFTTCNIYAWANGLANKWYGSVSVYNTWYAFITSAGCGY